MSFFARRFFTSSYFPAGYWPDTGATLPVLPVQLATTADVVLSAVRRMLIEGGVVGEANVIVSLTPEPYPGASGTMLFVCPRGFSPRAAHQEGMGRSLTTLDGSFTVDVVDLNSTDVGQQDLQRLTASGGNVLASAAGVLRVLQEQFVTASNGDHLSIEPIFSAGQAQPRKYGKGNAYGGIEMTFSVAFVADMV